MKDYIERLRGTCSLLKEETEGLTKEEVTLKSAPDKWCIKEIVWHLADGENRVFYARLKRILEEENPFFKDVNQDRLAQEGNYMEKNLKEGIEQFCRSRASSLKVIESAGEKDWKRTGIHQTFGPIMFEDIVEKMVDHDKSHMSQIRKIKEGLR